MGRNHALCEALVWFGAAGIFAALILLAFRGLAPVGLRHGLISLAMAIGAGFAVAKSHFDVAFLPIALGCGYAVHLAGDMLTSSGVPLLWPWDKHFSVAGIRSHGIGQGTDIRLDYDDPADCPGSSCCWYLACWQLKLVGSRIISGRQCTQKRNRQAGDISSGDTHRGGIRHGQRIKLEAARSEDTSAATLKMLAMDKGWWIRKAVVRNPSTPVDMLGKLAGDKNEWVCQAVAANKNILVEVLARLAGNGH